MIRYLLLGFLRDGRPRHGYALMKDAQAKLRILANSGSFYRELRMLERGGLVTVHDAGDDDEARRTSYVITPEGQRSFLAWLRSPTPDLRSAEDDLSARALFFRDTGEAESEQLVQRWQDRLWLECKILEREREELLTSGAEPGSTWIQELLLTRRIARTAADLEFLGALRAGAARDQGMPAAATRPVEAAEEPPRKATGSSSRLRKSAARA
jgi:DNA-binding PadR family transcriptional regulator